MENVSLSNSMSGDGCSVGGIALSLSGDDDDSETPALVGAGGVGPAWTRGELEKPAGTEDKGSWTAAVYTLEQQTRLGVDAQGSKRSGRKHMQSSATKNDAFDNTKTTPQKVSQAPEVASLAEEAGDDGTPAKGRHRHMDSSATKSDAFDKTKTLPRRASLTPSLDELAEEGGDGDDGTPTKGRRRHMNSSSSQNKGFDERPALPRRASLTPSLVELAEEEEDGDDGTPSKRKVRRHMDSSARPSKALDERATLPRRPSMTPRVNSVAEELGGDATAALKQRRVPLNPDFDEAAVVLNDAGFYDDVDIEDMDYDAATRTFTYPCPCGDRFEITETQLRDGDDVAACPSCSLRIRVVYEAADFDESEPDIPDSSDEDGI
jgi:diphthamide biosynthesis protein 3